MEEKSNIQVLMGSTTPRPERLKEITSFQSAKNDVSGPVLMANTVVTAKYDWKIKFSRPCDKEIFNGYYKSAIINCINSLFSLMGAEAADEAMITASISEHVGIDLKKIRLVYANRHLSYRLNSKAPEFIHSELISDSYSIVSPFEA